LFGTNLDPDMIERSPTAMDLYGPRADEEAAALVKPSATNAAGPNNPSRRT